MASHVIEFEGMQLYAPILFVLVFLLFFTVLLFLIRRAIVKRSARSIPGGIKSVEPLMTTIELPHATAINSSKSLPLMLPDFCIRQLLSCLYFTRNNFVIILSV